MEILNREGAKGAPSALRRASVPSEISQRFTVDPAWLTSRVEAARAPRKLLPQRPTPGVAYRVFIVFLLGAASFCAGRMTERGL